MNVTFQSLREDFSFNRKAGALALMFLWNYRVGRALLLLRRSGRKIAWIAYMPCLLAARFLNVVFGCSIPFSSEIGRRVVFPHGMYGVFISGKARVGDECTIMQHVTIGSNFSPGRVETGAPVLGKGTFVGVGAKLIGAISIGANVKVGANAVVVEDVEDGAVCRAPKAILANTSKVR